VASSKNKKAGQAQAKTKAEQQTTDKGGKDTMTTKKPAEKLADTP